MMSLLFFRCMTMEWKDDGNIHAINTLKFRKKDMFE